MKRHSINRVRCAIATCCLAAMLVAGCSQREPARSTAQQGGLASQADTRQTAPTEQPSLESSSTRTTTPASAAASDVAHTADLTTQSAAPKKEREPIYDPKTDGKALIAAAIERAARNDKHVLIEWGGNWCGWCYKLHDVFHNDPSVEPIVFQDYELVLIDEGTNQALMESYGADGKAHGYPYLTVLDANRKVVGHQDTGDLEDGPKHDPAKVVACLKAFGPKPVNAEERLAAALRTATNDNKRVLVHVGTPYCGWCRILSDFLHRHEELFASDYVDLRIDTMRMTGGEEVAKRYRPAGNFGIPWMVILDGSGKVLSTSIGPEGNTGYPVDPPEIEHFLSMLKSTAERMTAADLTEIRQDLDKYRVERDERQKAEAAKAITATEAG